MISPTLTSSTEPQVTVLWSDDQVVAVLKPAGTPSQADPSGDVDMLSQARKALKDQLLQLVHRLDRPVSGVLLLARTQAATRSLNEQFATARITKTYWAIVEGQYAGSDTLTHSIAHDAVRRKARAGDQRSVMLEVATLSLGDRYTLLEVKPHGGAFHQIRVQLSLAGYPIKGDVKYGARRGEKDRSVALHARSIAFLHPLTGSLVQVEAPPPEQPLWKALLAAR